MLRNFVYSVTRKVAERIQSKGFTMSTNIKSNSNNFIVWMDLEMTGLEIEKDTILEASCILTDGQLNIIAEGPSIVINQSESILSNMNEWCIKHHGQTGLTEASRKSEITVEKAEALLLDFLQQHIPPKVCPLAGNTIYVDRMFISKYMPQLNEYMHYRIIDISSIKELCQRWNPSVFAQAPRKRLVHRSLDDIKESIVELKYYKNFMFTTEK